MSEPLHQLGLGLLGAAAGVFVCLLTMGWFLIVLRGEEEWDALLRENRSLVRLALACLLLMALGGAILLIIA